MTGGKPIANNNRYAINADIEMSIACRCLSFLCDCLVLQMSCVLRVLAAITGKNMIPLVLFLVLV
jgi:hypothetical protein